MFLLWLKLSATHILLPQQPYLNVIERKYKRQILKPDPIILDLNRFYSVQVLRSVVKIVKNATVGTTTGTETTTAGDTTTTTGAPQITEGTCPLTQTDLDNGIANQRRISYEEEYRITKQNREREGKERQNKLFLSKPTRRWPNNEIPYLLGWYITLYLIYHI